MSSLAAFSIFVLVAVVAPGIALQRLLRVRVEPALVLPLGLVACASLHWLSLVAAAWLFPVGLAALVVPALASRRRSPEVGVADPSDWRAALLAAAALVAFLAVSVYSFNRVRSDGGFALDPIERIDTAFQVGLAWELSHSYPPQVPGLSGHVLSYHFGQHLVRAAAVRWAGLAPYDLLTRFDVTLCGLALVLAWRALVRGLGGRGLAVALAGLAPLLGDGSFVAGWLSGADWWTDLFSSNLHLSLAFGNTLVPALALVAAALVAFSRHEAEGRPGDLALAALLAAAVPQFKVFVAAQWLAGLALAYVVVRRRALLALIGPLGLGTLAMLAGSGGQATQIELAPLAPVLRTAQSLGWALDTPLALGLSAWAWIVSALGLRAVGLPELLHALRSARALPVTLAGAALAGLLPGLLLRITIEGEGADYNESVYFITVSAALLWLFTLLRLERWALAGRGALAAAAIALLALPVPAQFLWRKWRTPAETVPAAIVRVVARLAAEGRPGDVIVSPPSPRWPPPPMVLIGRRSPLARSLPYLSQYVPRAAFERRRDEVRAIADYRNSVIAFDRVQEAGLGGGVIQ